MKNLKDIIIERLHITKDTCPDISNQWANINDSTKYEYDATYYFFELIKDKVCWDPTNKTLLFINFDTTLSADDLKELNKTLGKDNLYRTDFYLGSHEWMYDGTSLYPSFRIRIHSLPMIKIYMNSNKKYSMVIENSAQTFYEKYYKYILK